MALPRKLEIIRNFMSYVNSYSSPRLSGLSHDCFVWLPLVSGKYWWLMWLRRNRLISPINDVHDPNVSLHRDVQLFPWACSHECLLSRCRRLISLSLVWGVAGRLRLLQGFILGHAKIRAFLPIFQALAFLPGSCADMLWSRAENLLCW